MKILGHDKKHGAFARALDVSQSIGLVGIAAGLAWEEYRVEVAPCACGRKTPRLTPAEPAERARAAAAFAR